MPARAGELQRLPPPGAQRPARSLRALSPSRSPWACARIAACRGEKERGMYDYVIVGAGSAGCVLAARLTEDPDVSGPAARGGPAGHVKENIHVPLGVPATLSRTDVDWDYCDGARAEGCDGRTHVPAPRQGPTAAPPRSNAMVYIRGNRARLRRMGRRGRPWLGLGRPPAVLPQGRGQRARRVGVPRRRRAAAGLRAAARGNTIAPPSSRPALQAGLPANEDFNGAEQDGVGMYQVTQRGGMRGQRRRRLPAPGDRAAEPDR